MVSTGASPPALFVFQSGLKMTKRDTGVNDKMSTCGCKKLAQFTCMMPLVMISTRLDQVLAGYVPPRLSITVLVAPDI